ncbi:AAA family ATPase [Coleofasciculus sp. E2-BRE-01]|uniref:AAA family ATPase n=1 Tax=Coleofasciculus sp. E2-BRE-01 TaxID=3069524 RepID=UPI003304BF3E
MTGFNRLAEADIRGRLCDDPLELLERVEFFREYCQENNCFVDPRPFPSDHSRFVYFQKDDRDPNYAAFDDTRFEVVLMSGLPGAGKDSWIQENLPDWTVISLDELRQAMKISPTDNQAAVAERARAIAKDYMRAEKSFVWNATNLSRQLRSSLINLFSAYHGRIRIVYLEAAWEELLRRNRSRATKVPEAVMQRMRDRVEVPDMTEAHQVEWVVDRAC